MTSPNPAAEDTLEAAADDQGDDAHEGAGADGGVDVTDDLGDELRDGDGDGHGDEGPAAASAADGDPDAKTPPGAAAAPDAASPARGAAARDSEEVGAVVGDARGVEDASSSQPTLRARRAPGDLDAGLLRAAGASADTLLESEPAPSTAPGFDFDDPSASSRPLTEPGITGEGEPTEPDGPSPLGLLELGPALEAALADAEALAEVRRAAAEDASGGRHGPSSQADARILEATRERLHEVREEVIALKRKLAAAEARATTAERDLETTRADLKATRQRFVRSSERQEAELKRHERQHRELPERLLRKHTEAIFPAIDALDAVVRQVGDAGDSVPEAVRTAVAMVQGEFERALGGLEITPFDALGQTFDPIVHAAVSERAAGDEERPGQVVGQIGRGYLLRGRLMRPAQVVVTAGGVATEVGVEEGEEATEVDREALG